MSDKLVCKCGYEAKSLSALHGHSKQHKRGKNLSKQKGIFPCLHCGKIFDTQSGLNGHKATHPTIVGTRAINKNQANESPVDIQENINDPDNILKRIRDKVEIQQEFERQKAMVNGHQLNFKVLPMNVYSSSFNIQDVAIKNIPSCKCIDDCIRGRCNLANDLMECHPGKCTAKKCTNNAISLARTQSTYINETREKGFGLFANNDIPANSFICEYIGEFINEAEVEKRSSDGNGHFLMSVQFAYGGIVGYIDSHRYGNCSAFINHSCSPNCQYEIWLADNLPRIAVYSLKEIARDDEITCSYGSAYERGIVCLCGNENCQGNLPF